jgi:hypothetical protein
MVLSSLTFTRKFLTIDGCFFLMFFMNIHYVLRTNFMDIHLNIDLDKTVIPFVVC